MSISDTTISITSCSSGDWVILSINGDEYTQGHSIDYLQLLKDLGYNVIQTELSDEDMEELVC